MQAYLAALDQASPVDSGIRDAHLLNDPQGRLRLIRLCGLILAPFERRGQVRLEDGLAHQMVQVGARQRERHVINSNSIALFVSVCLPVH